jgi:hypothetical protein
MVVELMIVGSKEEEQVVRELREIVARRPGKDPANPHFSHLS